MVDLKKMRLRALKEANVLGSDELSLFSWFLRETDNKVARMRRKELKALGGKHATGDPAPNDSGLIAVEYFSRRLQYSHVLQLAMLLEAVLKREVVRMIQGIGPDNVPFSPQDLKSDPWTANRKVLEAYGQFKIPEEVWSPIKDLINVRRVLVHENGYTGSFSKDEIAALRKISGIESFSPGCRALSACTVIPAIGILSTPGGWNRPIQSTLQGLGVDYGTFV